MHRITVVMACLALALPALADEPQLNQDEMMKAYEAAAKPGAPHELLARSAGNWTCTVKAWMDPAAEPMVSQGTETSEMIFDGRFLHTRFQGSMMGQPFDGIGLLGYDNGKKKYVGVWLDSMSTGIMPYEGDYDAQKKELVCRGGYVDALTGQYQDCKLVTRFVNDDRHVFEFWGPDASGTNEVKWMEMTYDRVK